MRKLLFTICAVLGILAIAGAALADGLCTVTVTADCDSVTVNIFVPKGEGGHTSATITLDGVASSFEFDGTTGETTIPNEGTADVVWDVRGTVTTGEQTKDFQFNGVASRGTCGTPSPSPTPPATTPPPTHHTTPPPLAFTGPPSWPLLGAVLLGIIGLAALGGSFLLRRSA